MKVYTSAGYCWTVRSYGRSPTSGSTFELDDDVPNLQMGPTTDYKCLYQYIRFYFAEWHPSVGCTRIQWWYSSDSQPVPLGLPSGYRSVGNVSIVASTMERCSGMKSDLKVLYELPTGDMLGAIVYEPGPQTEMDYNIVLEECSGHPQRVKKLHSSHMSLQFPLLFLYGEDGYSKELKLVGGTGTSNADKRLTIKAYYAYFIHDRENSYNYLSRTGRLFQQYVITAFCAIEQNRIDFIHEHQNDIRMSTRQGSMMILIEAIVTGLTVVRD
nr:DNA helicase [Tanacetum cinerariifolium]